MFHINGLLGTGFKVGDVVFTVAPGLCPFCGDLGGQKAASRPSAMQGGVLFSGQGQRPLISNLSSSDLIKAAALIQNTGDHCPSPDRPSPRERSTTPQGDETTEHWLAPTGPAQHIWGRRNSSSPCTSPGSCCNPSTSGQKHAVHRGLTSPGTRNPSPVADNI